MTVSASNGTGSRDKSKGQKLKLLTDAPAAPLPSSQAALTPSIPISHDVSVDIADDGSKGSDAKAASR